MPIIQFQLEEYAFGNKWGLKNGFVKADISLAELLHAAVTVGHPDYSVVLGGGSFYALSEAIWKASACLMTLRSARDEFWPYTPVFAPTERFLNLDPSEKRGATYQLGLTLTKVFARRFLGLNWLMHLDRYGQQFGITVITGRSRPDLFGIDSSGEWYAFESKGRVSAPSDEDKRKAKRQAERVTQISGVVPVLNATVFAYMNPRPMGLKLLEVYSEDPAPGGESQGKEKDVSPIVIDVSAKQVVADYYAPFIALFEQRTENSSQGFIEKTIPDADFTIRIESRIYELLRLEHYEKIPAILAQRNDATPAKSENRALASDGLEVIPGPKWSEIFNSKR